MVKIVSSHTVQDIMDNKQLVFFAIDAYVQGLYVRDLSDMTIFFRYNEATRGPFEGTTFFEDTKVNHALKFLFEGLFMSAGNRVCSVVHQFQAQEKINVDLFVWVNTKRSIKKFFMLGQDRLKIIELVWREMFLVSSYFVDVDLFIFSSKDSGRVIV